jgi:ubiquinone/menaquinone biosynthesis C-methylase UbiE
VSPESVQNRVFETIGESGGSLSPLAELFRFPGGHRMKKPLLVFGIIHWSIVVLAVCLALTLWRISWPWVLVGFFLYMIFFVFVVVRVLRHLYPFPIPSFMTRIIDNPMRRKYSQNPEVIAERMQLTPGMVVVEIGPGKGSYTKAVARRILPDGIVYAVDISEAVVEHLKVRFDKEGVANVIPRIEDAYHFTFSDKSVDRVFAVSCLPEIPEPIRIMEECRRILKPNGLLCLNEWVVDPDYRFRTTEKSWARQAGLELKQEFGNWVSYQLHFGKIFGG